MATYNKSEIFAQAWGRYKANRNRLTFARSLKMAWEFAKEQAGVVVEQVKAVVVKTNAQIIQAVKEVLLGFTSNSRTFKANHNDMAEMADTLVSRVAEVTGFAGDVAKTVEKYGKVSEKQAYIIARAAVENNRLGQYENFFAN